MRAVLEVQSPGADLRLGDQHPRLTGGEGQELLFLCFVRVGAIDLDGTGDDALQ